VTLDYQLTAAGQALSQTLDQVETRMTQELAACLRGESRKWGPHEHENFE
jgi:hypothetical protein